MVWLLLWAMSFATLGTAMWSESCDRSGHGKYQQRGSAKDFRFCAGVVFFGLCQRDLGPSGSEPLLTVILADAINLGLNKMAEACPGTSIAKLSWLSAWHIRDETYRKALATLVNHQLRVLRDAFDAGAGPLGARHCSHAPFCCVSR
jgi:hypothetical protein